MTFPHYQSLLHKLLLDNKLINTHDISNVSLNVTEGKFNLEFSHSIDVDFLTTTLSNFPFIKNLIIENLNNNSVGHMTICFDYPNYVFVRGISYNTALPFSDAYGNNTALSLTFDSIKNKNLWFETHPDCYIWELDDKETDCIAYITRDNNISDIFRKR